MYYLLSKFSQVNKRILSELIDINETQSMLIKCYCYKGDAVPVPCVPDEMPHFSSPQKECKAILDHLTGIENIQ